MSSKNDLNILGLFPVPYLLMERKDLDVMEALKTGWGILALFTFGIGFLWLIPYIYVSYAKFYEDVKAGAGTTAEAEAGPRDRTGLSNNPPELAKVSGRDRTEEGYLR